MSEKLELIQFLNGTTRPLPDAMSQLKIAADPTVMEAELSDAIFRCVCCRTWTSAHLQGDDDEHAPAMVCLKCTL